LREHSAQLATADEQAALREMLAPAAMALDTERRAAADALDDSVFV
jgi:hypothetical protein